MKSLPGIAAAAFFLMPFVAALAQDGTYHHVHIRADDPKAAAVWYTKYMGGTEIDRPGFHGVVMGSTYLFVFPAKMGGVDGSKNPDPEGPLLGSVGTPSDHLGWSFKDLGAKMKEFKDAGIEIVQDVREVPGKFKFAMIMDPWGTKIEVMEDPELYGFHHVHVVSKDPATAIKWYQEIFGGEITTYKGLKPLHSIRYGDVWLIITKTDKDLEPMWYRSIDHLGWGFNNLGKEMERFEKRGEKLPVKMYDYKGTNIAYIESPEGALIELVETKAK
jgi:catechol 2,3-dioxygenase-like lactoylglutathione lyase family enzyme